MVKIRLKRFGTKKRPFYRIVVMDSKVARDGKVITEIGIYNPLTEPATVEIDEEQAIKYLQSGARPTQTVRALLRQKGILEKIHKAKQQAKQAK